MQKNMHDRGQHTADSSQYTGIHTLFGLAHESQIQNKKNIGIYSFQYFWTTSSS